MRLQLLVPGVGAKVSARVQRNFRLTGFPDHEVGLADGGDVVQKGGQTEVIRNNLRSHTVLRYLSAESVKGKQADSFYSVDISDCVVKTGRQMF